MSFLRNYYHQIANSVSGVNSDDVEGLQNKLDLKVNKDESYGYFPVWAEESADLSNNSFQWSFGNGNLTPSGMGVVIPFTCELVAMGLTLENNATCEVQARKNNSSAGKSVSTSSNKTGWVIFENNPVSYSGGDVLGFKTATGGESNGTVVAWFRKLTSN